jgi:hypothetical protein
MIQEKIKVDLNYNELVWLKMMVEETVTDPERPKFKEQLLAMLVLRGLAKRLHAAVYEVRPERKFGFKDTEAVALVLAYTRGWLATGESFGESNNGVRLMITRVAGLLDQKTQ